MLFLEKLTGSRYLDDNPQLTASDAQQPAG
jgi:hypothetical protein